MESIQETLVSSPEWWISTTNQGRACQELADGGKGPSESVGDEEKELCIFILKRRIFTLLI